MNAVRVAAFGGPEVLELVDVPEPVAERGQVGVRVVRCGLNFSDVLARAGAYPGGPVPPYIPGIEAAGVIDTVGDGVDSSRIGERVVAITRNGAHALFAVADADACIRLPDSLDFARGAAFAVSHLSAYYALVTAARAQPGETALIHAGGGALGTAAIQIAKLLELRVVAVASSDQKRAIARGAGADDAVDYADLRRGPRCDIALCTTGGDALRDSLRMLAPLGRAVVLGLAGGPPAAVDVAALLFRSQSLIGFHLSAHLADHVATTLAVRRLFSWMASGELTVRIGHELGLTEIGAAHTLMESRNSLGKIVLHP